MSKPDNPKGIENKNEKEELRKKVVSFMDSLFLGNETFLKKAKRGYRKNADEKVLKSLEAVEEEVLREIESGEYGADTLSESEFKRLVLKSLGKIKKREGMVVSKSFKKSVQTLCGDVENAGIESEKKKQKPIVIADLSEEEMQRVEPKKEKRKNGKRVGKAVLGDISTEDVGVVDVELEKEKMRKEFGKEGMILKNGEGEDMVIDKFIVTPKGVLRVAFYDIHGERIVVDADKFRNKINWKESRDAVDYKEKSIEYVKKSKRMHEQCLDLIDKLSGTEEKQRYKERTEKIMDSLDEFIGADKDNGILEEMSVEDFADVRRVFFKMIKITNKLREFVKKEKEEKEKQKETAQERKNNFEKKYGRDANYILLEGINGHTVPTDSFVLMGYFPADVRKNDKVKIRRENGEEELITEKNFADLLKKGYKKEIDESVKKKNKADKKEQKAERRNESGKSKQENEGGESNRKNENDEVVGEAKKRAKRYRDKYFAEMGWGSEEKRKKEAEELSVAVKEFLRENPDIEKEIVERILETDGEKTPYNKADLKDKVLMALGEKSNQARRKYLEKDYDMDRRLGKMKRFFGKTFRMDRFEKEIEEYKKEYETAREKYKDAILRLEGLNDREEAEILARDFYVSEYLRAENDRLDIALENNPLYEHFKKFLLGAVNKYREMRKWPGNKISELFGFKGLSKGIGIVSGALVVGKGLKEVGLIGNPAFRVFSVAVSGVGYKQFLETVSERRRIKKGEESVKEALNMYGGNLEVGKGVFAFEKMLSEENKALNEKIQNEKYWRNWRTVMAGGLALGTFFGGGIIGEKIMKHFGGHSDIFDGNETRNHTKDVIERNIADNGGRVNSGKIKEAIGKFFGDTHFKKTQLSNLETSKNIETDTTHSQVLNEHFDGSNSNGGGILEPEPLEYDDNMSSQIDHSTDTTVNVSHHETRSVGVNEARRNYVEKTNDDGVTVFEGRTMKVSDEPGIQHIPSGGNISEKVSSGKTISSQNKISDIINPNIAEGRNITGTEMQVAYGLGFSPEQYARLNDLPLSQVGNAKLRTLMNTVAGSGGNIDFNRMTLGEFLREIKPENLPREMKFSDMTFEKYVEYLAKVINNEATELKKTITDGNLSEWRKVKDHLAMSELNDNFRAFYSDISRKFSLFARPTETVDGWMTRVTKFAYERGILPEIKKELRDVVMQQGK